MKLTAEREKELANVFEEIFSQKEMLSNALLRDDEHFFETVTDEALMDEGYPENANYHNTSMTVEMESKIAYDMWAEIYWYDEDMENFEDLEEEFKNHLEREDTFIQCILNNTDRVDFNVVIYDSIEEVRDANPDFEHFEAQFYNLFDTIDFKTYIESDPHLVEDAYNEALIDEFGRSDNIPDDVEVLVYDLVIDKTILEVLYEKYNSEVHTSVSEYMTTSDIYNDIIEHDAVAVVFDFNYDDADKEEENPSVEYLEKALSTNFEVREFASLLRVECREEILDELNQKAIDEGFNIDEITDLTDTPISWKLIVNSNPSMQKFAELLYEDNTIPEAYDTVTAYVTSPEFYEDLIEEDIVGWDVEILSNPEDF